jgi:multidrug resistance protein, MATE family
LPGAEEATMTRPPAMTEPQPVGLASGFAVEVGPMMRLALPVVLSELGWMAMGVVDVMMVGRLGPEAIGAAGIGNIVFFSVAIFGIGLLLGLDTVVSQSFGAGDLKDCHRSLVQGVYLALAVSIPLTALIAAATHFLPWAGITPSVGALATPYLIIQNISLAPLLVFFALRRYLQSMNLAMPALVALAVANVANLFGNWVFVYGRLGFPELGVAGSAWSTLVSRVAMLAFLAIYAAVHAARTRNGLLQTSLKFDPSRMRELVKLGLPTAIQLTLEIAVFCAAALLAARLGEIELAAHEVVLQVAGTAFMVPLGVSSAGAVRVGQAIGRKDPRGARRSGWTALGLGSGFMALSGLTMLLASGPILGVFTSDRALIATARSLLIAAAIFQVFDGLQVVGSGILRGLGETQIPMYATLAAHWAIGLPIGYVMAFPMGWGIVGVWMGLCSGLVAAGVMLLAAWVWRARRLDREFA